MAARKLKIQVKSRHIVRGEPRNAVSCPIALACQELEGVESASVDLKHITLTGNQIPVAGMVVTGEITFPTPPAGKAFVERFDAGKRSVKPLTFSL